MTGILAGGREWRACLHQLTWNSDANRRKVQAMKMTADKSLLNWKLRASVVAGAAVVVSVLIGYAVAQNHAAGVSGRVFDPVGAVVPNTSVNIDSRGGGPVGTTSTNSEGAFQISLPPGFYTITARRAGFATASRDVAVKAGKIGHLAITLKVAISDTPARPEVFEDIVVPGSQLRLRITYGDTDDRLESNGNLAFTGHHAHSGSIILSFDNMTFWADQVRVIRDPLRIDAVSTVSPIVIDNPPSKLAYAKGLSLTFANGTYKISTVKCTLEMGGKCN